MEEVRKYPTVMPVVIMLFIWCVTYGCWKGHHNATMIQLRHANSLHQIDQPATEKERAR